MNKKVLISFLIIMFTSTPVLKSVNEPEDDQSKPEYYSQVVYSWLTRYIEDYDENPPVKIVSDKERKDIVDFFDIVIKQLNAAISGNRTEVNRLTAAKNRRHYQMGKNAKTALKSNFTGAPVQGLDLDRDQALPDKIELRRMLAATIAYKNAISPSSMH